MLVRAALVLLAVWLVPQPPRSQPQPESGRVFLLSLDGLGYQRLTEDPVVEAVPTLRTLLKSGAYVEGMSPAFPASTASSHAALWTGTYAGRNGILHNSTPRLPRSEHTHTERVVGYRSESLIAEPIWLAAARQGVPVVAHQVTQIVPFLPQTVGDRPMPDLVGVNGFQSRTFARWRALRADDIDVRTVPCVDLLAHAPRASRCVEWSLGPSSGDRRLRAALLEDRLVIAQAGGAGAIDVVQRATETTPPEGRALARHWSAPLAIAGLPDAVAASLVFRLFEVDQARGTFLLMQSPLTESAVVSTDPSLAAALVAETGPMVGNGDWSAYASGDFGVPAYEGGSGEAERRYLETLELVVRQQMAQSGWLFRRRDPRLHISYLSTADDLDHAWYGLDRAGGGRFTEFRRWGYMAIEQAVRAFTKLAAPSDHVVITSDHGMTAVTELIDVDRLIDEASLGTLASPAYSCFVLNTTDRKGGIITADGRDAAVDRVRRALMDLDRDDGTPAVARVYWTREEMAALGHDGPGGADLCFDPVPGVGIGVSPSGAVVSAVSPPRGVHGLDPSRADMKAILLVTGPRAAAGRSLGSLPSLVVAPLVADLLGIRPPREATASSPLSARER